MSYFVSSIKYVLLHRFLICFMLFALIISPPSFAQQNQKPSVLKHFSDSAVMVTIPGRNISHSATSSPPTTPAPPSANSLPSSTEQDLDKNTPQISSPISPHLLPENEVQTLLRSGSPPSLQTPATETFPPLPPAKNVVITQKQKQVSRPRRQKSKPVEPVSLGKSKDTFFASLATPRPTFTARDDLSAPKQQISPKTSPLFIPPNPTQRHAILVHSQKKIILTAWITGPEKKLALPKSCHAELQDLAGQTSAPDWFKDVCELDKILYVTTEQARNLSKP